MNFGESANCQACGEEFPKAELTKTAIAGFNKPLLICKYCSNKSPQQDYSDIVNTLRNIVKSSGDVKNRFKKIEKILLDE